MPRLIAGERHTDRNRALHEPTFLPLLTFSPFSPSPLNPDLTTKSFAILDSHVYFKVSSKTLPHLVLPLCIPCRRSTSSRKTAAKLLHSTSRAQHAAGPGLQRGDQRTAREQSCCKSLAYAPLCPFARLSLGRVRSAFEVVPRKSGPQRGLRLLQAGG